MNVSGEDIPAARLLAQVILAECGQLLMASRDDNRVGASIALVSREPAVPPPAVPSSDGTPERPKSVTTKQASALIGIRAGSIRRLIRVGRIGAVQLGRSYVIPVEEIDRILAPARRDGMA